MTQAVILAAGIGSRLEASTEGLHKSLLKVGRHRLIEHQLDLLAAFGIKSICIVVGHRADQIRFVVGNKVDYIVNERYAETNSLYSLWLASEWISGPFVLMNCDVLAHPEILGRVLTSEGSSLAYDSSSGHEDEHMKVAFDGGYLKEMSKELSQVETEGENVGILRFDRHAAALLISEANAFITSGNQRQWVAAACSRVASQSPIRGVDIAGLPWTEIDFPWDLEHARRHISPLIPCCSDKRHVNKYKLRVGINQSSVGTTFSGWKRTND